MNIYLNILIKDYLKNLEEAGVDAVIISDPASLKIAKENNENSKAKNYIIN